MSELHVNWRWIKGLAIVRVNNAKACESISQCLGVYLFSA
ncbi:hypothetical protein PHO31112_04727 [Pandoraea horticolens]|uniref:Uncharacterized protein n=1 Tax=Pandoraea horticolens TaxID=2508298 RepID=A0A5E4YS17_9BURK|nr:hypothetical protein PHO31112_04727 [Pandoraea horticolens]